MQAVLCGTDVGSIEGNGATKLQKRIQTDFAPAYVGSAASLEETTDDICEFDE